MRGFLVPTFVAFMGLGCGDEPRSRGPSEPALPGRVASTRGSAIVLTRDETIAVATNRTAGAISILRLDPSKEPRELLTGESVVELDTGAGSEPWAAVIGNDDDTAYVVMRRDGVIQRVTGLRSTPRLNGRLAVGSEPTAISISPSGTFLFVANWGDGTLSLVRPKEFEEEIEPLAPIDMNEKLAGSGVLGAIDARPGLAHPRALAMTDDRDDADGDEMLYLTEFFSQPLPGVTDDAEHLSVDRNRQGFLYSFPVSGAGVASAPVVALPPVQETDFADADRRKPGCVPNQLYAAAADGGQLFVTAMCASPRGPVGTKPNVQTALHPTLFVVDTASDVPVALEPIVLTEELARRYEADGTNADARMPLIPNDIAIARGRSPSGVRSAYVTAFGADAVFRLDVDASGALVDIGSPGARFIDLVHSSGAGLLPIGVALSASAEHPFALVLCDNTQNVAVIDRATDDVVRIRSTTGNDATTGEQTRANDVLRTDENAGRRRFATGRDVWSLDGNAWSSCESCHPDGLSDGLTWYFTRGPRRTISTAATYDEETPKNRRIMLWTANVDEIHDVEGITRSVSGGAGGILWDYDSSADCRILYDGKGCDAASPAGTCRLAGTSATDRCDAPKHTTSLLNGLNGALSAVISQEPSCLLDAERCDVSAVPDWGYIDAYIRSVRSPNAPAEGSDPGQLRIADIDRGIHLFRAGRCGACHGGPGWTISKLFYDPGPAANGSLPFVPPPADTSILGMLGSLRTTTYRPDPGFPPALNPPSAGGEALLRSWAPLDASEAAARAYAYDTGALGDQINCVLRDVGTFPLQAAGEVPNTVGIVARGAPGVPEVRSDMTTLALGASGFNVPSLLGLASRAPYYHAGNARTLEEAFDPMFRAHHQAAAPDFLANATERASQVRDLVAFLLSIDDSTPLERIPDDLGYNPVLCRPPAD